jgi:hypothetical protein
MANVNDRRTAEQMVTHRWLVCGTDTFLSGWGGAKRGRSLAAWACRREHLEKVERWVRGRSDMKRVRVEVGKLPFTKSGDHLSVYVVEPGHPALD